MLAAIRERFVRRLESSRFPMLQRMAPTVKKFDGYDFACVMLTSNTVSWSVFMTSWAFMHNVAIEPFRNFVNKSDVARDMLGKLDASFKFYFPHADPKWLESFVLTSVTLSLPPQVWLVSFSSMAIGFAYRGFLRRNWLPHLVGAGALISGVLYQYGPLLWQKSGLHGVFGSNAAAPE
ncbi:MAG: hypothetical protein MHM6MM_003132 [Cercozoa sp. M6MM]